MTSNKSYDEVLSFAYDREGLKGLGFKDWCDCLVSEFGSVPKSVLRNVYNDIKASENEDFSSFPEQCANNPCKFLIDDPFGSKNFAVTTSLVLECLNEVVFPDREIENLDDLVPILWAINGIAVGDTYQIKKNIPMEFLKAVKTNVISLRKV